MQFSRDELLLLSRSGHVPRSTRPQPRRYWHAPPLAESPHRGARGARQRLRPLLRRLPTVSSPTRGELDIQAYLELEFTVDDRR